MAEPIELPFGAVSGVGSTNGVLVGHGRAHWHQLENAIK